ncbi:benzoate/H(+) symporter BenE family transporter [Achromobacter sp. GG226]|uniref:benzoate/H(+) symporter BenE family transporter n=1 Tax=Verticiella alkaliphila TaxID=2779529 RepID=UPI001C0B844C|nr:benzoate/H(+) symporter BenE family transporter [Verticiella sp. GG226]MBU4612401.1 benzoate/H(+) symporter BenE family transporter [Verticiella sp. GG226]
MTTGVSPQATPPTAGVRPPGHRSDDLRAVLAGLLASLVGFGSTFAVVIQGLGAAGADTAQITSGLFMLCLSVGAVAIAVALRYRTPVGIAWSTPAAALLVSTGTLPGGFAVAVGAFLVAGLLIVISGLWRPLGTLITRIPAPIANAMLAGVLLKLCLAPFGAIDSVGWPALVLLGVYVVAFRFARLFAVPATVVAAFALLALDPAGHAMTLALPSLTWVTPVFTWDGVVGLALPLFLVTMASQNIPGIAVLSVYGYHPPAGPLFRTTGGASMLTAPFGVPTISLAAITAALIASPDAHPRPDRRYLAAVMAGVGYVALALLAAVAASAVTASPPVLIQAVAGLALLGALGSSLVNGLKDEPHRPAALFTFLVTASGISPLGIGAAFWGLVAGLAVHALQHSVRS